MSAMWNRTLVYLGLREEPEEVYDDLPERFVPEDDPHAEHARERRPTSRTSSAAAGATGSAAAARRPDVRGEEGGPRLVAADDETNVRPLRTGDVTVRQMPTSSARAAVVELDGFDDVEAVGARYRTGQPVLFDVSRLDTTTARRVVDFVSGLTYGLRGKLTKVGSRAFLLVPDGVDLPGEERMRLRELGYRLPTGSEG